MMKARLFTFPYANSAEIQVLEKYQNFWAPMKLIISQNILQFPKIASLKMAALLKILKKK